MQHYNIASYPSITENTCIYVIHNTTYKLTYLAQDRDKRGDLMNSVMNHRFS
jgi:hypothetical protein